MPIFDDTDERWSITEGWRALDLFSNRAHTVRLFASRLNDDPPEETILWFYGEGGNGKSLLLRYLAEHFTKRLLPENWAYLRDRGLSDEALKAELEVAEGTEAVPFGYLDFGVQPKGEDRPREAFSALLMLRRSLAPYGVRTPLFDYACLLYLRGTGALSSERIRLLFPESEQDFINSLVKALTEGHWTASILFPFIEGRLGSRVFALYRAERKLEEEEVERLGRLDPHRELYDELPLLFARDVSAFMSVPGAPARLCLLFDTYEAFWGEERELPAELYFERDEWVRRLLGRLELAQGIVAVVASRTPPRWDEAPKAAIPRRFLDLHPVGGLSTRDARDYLHRAGVPDHALQDALLSYTSLNDDEHHPFYLGLAADLALAAKEKGEPLSSDDLEDLPRDQGAALVHRLLRYVPPEVAYATRALSAARAFDENLYRHLGEELNFRATAPAFAALCQSYSFVSHDEPLAEGRYEIHSLLRRLLEEQEDELLPKAHTVLEVYYRAKFDENPDDVVSRAETIYHANRLDWKRGVGEWLDEFPEALYRGKHRLCRALIEVASDLRFEGEYERGKIGERRGEFFYVLDRYQEAEAAFKEALSAYDEALRIDPDSYSVRVDKGDIFRQIGQIQEARSSYAEAEENLKAALASFEEALPLNPESSYGYGNKGIALTVLAEIQIERGSYGEAQESLRAAIAAYDQALRLGIDPPTSGHVNKGIALVDLGVLHQREGGSAEEAKASLQNALSVYDEALRSDPDRLFAHEGRGRALTILAEVHKEGSSHKGAEASIRGALLAYDEALRLAPEYPDAHTGRGRALTILAQVQIECSSFADAEANLVEALSAHEESLRLAPNSAEPQREKAKTLLSLGKLQHDRGSKGSPDTLSAARATLTRAVQLAPGHPEVKTLRDEIERWLRKAWTEPRP